jgi:hypothetical protein
MDLLGEFESNNHMYVHESQAQVKVGMGKGQFIQRVSADCSI